MTHYTRGWSALDDWDDLDAPVSLLPSELKKLTGNLPEGDDEEDQKARRAIETAEERLLKTLLREERT